LNRKYWITSTNDFKRVRLSGKSYAHPLVVIICAEGTAENSRVGLITGKSIGKAVRRNKARRRLRMIFGELMPEFTSCVDMVVIGRPAIDRASYVEIKAAIRSLLERARVTGKNDSL
jgi:ribonuclease P protein component